MPSRDYTRPVRTLTLLACLAPAAACSPFAVSSPSAPSCLPASSSTSTTCERSAEPTAVPRALEHQIRTLTVARESHGNSYERDAFGDYDRDAMLSRNLSHFPDCAGYFSRYDGECYALADYPSAEAADDEVAIDEAVARKEAWQSGAYQWPASKLERFGGDPRNLSVMTAELNSSKSASDVTEWVPPREASTCRFVRTVVDVKSTYGLAVDHAEKNTLLQLAAACAANHTSSTR